LRRDGAGFGGSDFLSVQQTSKTKPDGVTPEELRRVVKKHLPAWFKACAADAETIVMHEESFGASAGEMFLLGCALKYAARSGKTVHVTWGEQKPAPRWKLKTISVEAIYRENPPSPVRRVRRHAPTRRLLR
jgi:hypothetical protein